MDYRENWEDHQETLKAILDGRQTQIWTSIPGIVQSFNATMLTVSVQPSVQAQVTATDETTQFTNMALVNDVPVCFPRGGSYTLTFPVQQGDECLLVFSSRAIDSWWQSGGIQQPFSLRQHDLSDGFAFVGPFSQQTKLTNVNTTTTQLRSNDDTIFVEVDFPNKKIRAVAAGAEVDVDGTANTITLTATTKVNINSPLTVCSGDIHANGNIIAGNGEVTLLGHRHGITGNTASSTIPPSPGT